MDMGIAPIFIKTMGEENGRNHVFFRKRYSILGLGLASTEYIFPGLLRRHYEASVLAITWNVRASSAHRA